MSQSSVFERTRRAGRDPMARDMWLKRLRTLRGAVAAWDLRFARTLAPRFVSRVLARLLPGESYVKAVDTRRWSFRQVRPRDERDAMVDRIDRLMTAFHSATGTGNDDLCLLEEELALHESRRNKSRERAREARAHLMQRLLMTHEDKLVVLFYCTDPCAAPESHIRTKNEPFRRYPVDRLNLVRAGVDVCFTHHYTTLRGDRLQRDVSLRFVLPDTHTLKQHVTTTLELHTEDGSRHQLLLARPGVDYNPDTLSARSALALARSWRNFDTPESYAHLTKARFPNKADWDPEEEEEEESDSNHSSDHSDEEEAPAATDKSFTFGSQVEEEDEAEAAPQPQPQPMVKVKMELDLEFDADTTLADMLQRLPARPTPATSRRIIIDITDD